MRVSRDLKRRFNSGLPVQGSVRALRGWLRRRAVTVLFAQRCYALTSRRSSTRCVRALFADTESGKNAPQQFVRAVHADDLAQGQLRTPELLGNQLRRAAARQMPCRLQQMGVDPC